MKRQEVYEQIDKERDHQDLKHNKSEEIPAELLLMEVYLEKAQFDWAYKMNSLHQIRKVVALGIRCLETHGCPERKK